MVADSTSGPAGVWAAGIQVEAAANPKESSPWLPAPASTGLHADVAGEHVHAHRCTRRSYIHARAHKYTSERARANTLREGGAYVYARDHPLISLLLTGASSPSGTGE